MKTRILIVDDAVFMRNMLRDVLCAAGYDIVGEAANGIEAIEKYEALHPDLVTMDIIMPFKSGIEATREIIQTHPKAMIVICSALGQDLLVKEALEAGAVDFIVKPFQLEAVQRVIEQALHVRAKNARI